MTKVCEMPEKKQIAGRSGGPLLATTGNDISRMMSQT
jgi:hypothetical protein